MSKTNYLWGIAGFAILYVLCVYASAFLGFTGPEGWVFFPSLAAFVGAFSYLWIAARWQRFGAGFLLSLLLAVFLLISGEVYWSEGVLVVTVGLFSDLLRLWVGNSTKRGIRYAYTLLSLQVMSCLVPLWTRPEWYYQGAIEEEGVAYADRLIQFSTGWWFVAAFTATALMGYAGIRLAIRWMRPAAKRLQDTDGLFTRFFKTSARPSGWLGRLNVRLMNLMHTPQARWNLSLIPFEKQWTVLDIGCGGGKNIARMLRRCPEGKVYGIDISEESVRISTNHNKRHIGTRCFISKASVESLPFEAEQFDLVTAFETVYFWPNLPLCFGEIKRVLKPNGLFVFSYGVQENAVFRSWEQMIDEMKLLSVDELKQLLTKAGFIDISITEKDHITLNIQARKG